MQQGIMLPPVTMEKPKYMVSLRQAHNGFAVYLEEEIQPKRSLHISELEKNLGGIVKTVQDTMEGNEIADIRRKNDEKGDNGEIKIKLGLHVFNTFSEMTAFLSFVFEENEKK